MIGRYEMNNKQSVQLNAVRSAKEIARTAVFVAMVIGAQYAFSAVPFVEIVTLLFACYAYVFGAVRGAVSAVAFSLLRQLLFGFYPVVLMLYLAHFSLLSVVFGVLGKYGKRTGWKRLALVVAVAVVTVIMVEQRHMEKPDKVELVAVEQEIIKFVFQEVHHTMDRQTLEVAVEEQVLN